MSLPIKPLLPSLLMGWEESRPPESERRAEYVCHFRFCALEIESSSSAQALLVDQAGRQRERRETVLAQGSHPRRDAGGLEDNRVFSL